MGKQLAVLGTQRLVSLKQFDQSGELEIDQEQSEKLLEAFNTGMINRIEQKQSVKNSSDEDWEESDSAKEFIRDDGEDNVRARERFIQARYAVKLYFKSPEPELGDGDYQAKEL
jgi:hypothetical protein